ncbi:unnamed protein product [Heligmosomoides polygyrus]|uniref:Myelin basic protein n=1 Tax=Heligmosomoides polygyrus TaxID=6339 RepID=A0A183FUZ2_HELPZ|nr:unnamed protein product [Heligmosomoides polygyrus]
MMAAPRTSSRNSPLAGGCSFGQGEKTNKHIGQQLPPPHDSSHHRSALSSPAYVEQIAAADHFEEFFGSTSEGKGDGRSKGSRFQKNPGS